MSRVNVVVFGCDNTGKTTLCNNLNTTLNSFFGVKSEVIKSLGPASFPDQVQFLEKNLGEMKDGIYIYDRFPIIEEQVCGTVLRGSNKFDGFGEYVSKTLNKITFFIHCDPGLEKIQQWGTREQMEGIKENAKALNDGYKACANLFGIYPRVIPYNFLKDDWNDIAKLIYSYYTLGGN